MDLQNKFSNQISLSNLNLKNSPNSNNSSSILQTVPQQFSKSPPHSRTRTRVQRFHNRRLTITQDWTKSRQQNIPQSCASSDSSPTTPEDKTSVMHNAFDGISGDFRPANVNRRKKRNRHPSSSSSVRFPWPIPPSSFPESIDSEATMEASKKIGPPPPSRSSAPFRPKLFKPLPTLFYLPFTAPLRPLSLDCAFLLAISTPPTIVVPRRGSRDGRHPLSFHVSTAGHAFPRWKIAEFFERNRNSVPPSREGIEPSDD